MAKRKMLFHPDCVREKIRASQLAAAEIKSEQTHRYVAELPPVLSKEEWLEKYGKCDQGVRLPDKPDRPLH